jgi:hypothetical protein
MKIILQILNTLGKQRSTGGKREVMTQTLYAHMNKIKIKKKKKKKI